MRVKPNIRLSILRLLINTLCLTVMVFFSSSLYGKDSSSCLHSDVRFNCVKYLKNYDGDTISFDIPNIHPLIGKKVSVRVSGIDTAEVRTSDQCEKVAARSARKLVTNLLKNAKRVDLNNVTRGKYFRIVADVILDGRNLKDILIQNRLAYAYDGGKKRKPDWCQLGRVPAEKWGGAEF